MTESKPPLENSPSTDDASDPRFTVGLLFDVEGVLRRHGYEKHPDVRVNADVLVLTLKLVEAFEGKNLR